MTGISEVLVLILLICGILIVPRMFKPAPANSGAKKKKTPQLFSMKLRAGILVSIVFPILTAFVIRPWQDQLFLYLSIGLLPVAFAWGLFWVLAAKKK